MDDRWFRLGDHGRSPAIEMPRFTFFLVAILTLGCTERTDPKARFTQVRLDGAELASLLNMNCVKYEYTGQDREVHWRVLARHYGPDDELVKQIRLGGGGCGLRSGSSFACSIPVFDGGNAAIRFFGMSTNTEIDALLPERQVHSSSGWNDQVDFRENEPMILYVSAVDTKNSVSFPNTELPRGHGGHVVAIVLEIKDYDPGTSHPWGEPSDSPKDRASSIDNGSSTPGPR